MQLDISFVLILFGYKNSNSVFIATNISLTFALMETKQGNFMNVNKLILFSLLVASTTVSMAQDPYA